MSPVHLALTATGMRAARHGGGAAAVAGPVVLVLLGVGWMAAATAYCAFGLPGLAAVTAAGVALAALLIHSEAESRARTAAAQWARYEAGFVPALRPVVRTLASPVGRARAFAAAGLWAPQNVEIRPTTHGAVLTITGLSPAEVDPARAVLAAALGAPRTVSAVVRTTARPWVLTVHLTAH